MPMTPKDKEVSTMRLEKWLDHSWRCLWLQEELLKLLGKDKLGTCLVIKLYIYSVGVLAKIKGQD